MIKSMTGYGRNKYEIDGRSYQVEIKAVNHKYTDISIRAPRIFNFLEDNLRKKLAESISRGKIDVFVSFDNYSEKGRNIKFNKELAKIYIQNLNELASETGIENKITTVDISKFPDIIKLEDEEDEELLWNELNVCLDGAISNFIEMRKQEGKRMCEDIIQRINIISEKLDEICKYSSGLVEEYIVKLEARIKEILKTDVVDKDRLAQEIVIYSDKCSIEEEITRLKSHISQFKSLLEKEAPVGKNIDFLVQEMNREINTMGSKANCLEITNRVVEMKTELENIREQVQNIE